MHTASTASSKLSRAVVKAQRNRALLVDLETQRSFYYAVAKSALLLYAWVFLGKNALQGVNSRVVYIVIFLDFHFVLFR